MDILGQFADDTDLFLEGKEEIVNKLFEVIDNFYQISGMQVNYQKTTLYRLGSLCKSEAKLYTEKDIHWQNDEMDVLGVAVMSDKNKLLERNYEKIFMKMTNILRMWKTRNISLCGKVLVINSLIASLFVYKMVVLPSISESYVKRFKKMVQDFIWNNRKPKISMEKLCCNKNQGGLKLVDIKVKDNAMKVQWVKMISEDPYMRELAFNRLNCKMYEFIFRSNLRKEDIIDNFVDNFWRDVLLAWFEFAFIAEPKEGQIWAQSIWYNSHIRVKNKVIYDKTAFDNGLRTIWDIFDYEQNTFLRAEEIAVRYGIPVMKANSILSAIPPRWKTLCKSINELPQTTVYDDFITKQHSTKLYYNKIIENESILFNTYANWQSKIQSDLSIF